MIDWVTVLSLGSVPVVFTALGLWAVWFSGRDSKADSKGDQHTPAE